MKIYDYFNLDGSYRIRINAESQERADLLFKFAFSGTPLTQTEWEKDPNNHKNYLLTFYGDYLKRHNKPLL